MNKIQNVIYWVVKSALIGLSVIVIIWVINISFPFYKEPEFIKSFASNVLATLIGAVCGLIIVFWVNDLERTKSRKDNESQTQANKEKVLKVLIDDLKHNLEELNRQSSPQESDAFILRTNLKVEAWKSFANGGELQSINDPEVIHRLADMFDKTSSIIYLLELLTDFGSGRGSYKSINSQGVPKQLQEMISKLCKEIDSFLNDKKAKV